MKPFTLNAAGRIIKATHPLLMGILNVTPDSFYDGGKYENNYLTQVEKMLMEGADFIDIGGMSSKPGAGIIDPDIELQRVLPVVKNIVKNFPEARLSIDTIHSLVAKATIEHGISLINDISAGELDEKIIDVAASFQIPYICMHMKGIPETMHLNPTYNDVVEEVHQYLQLRINYLQSKGVYQIIVDPGFGFGKTINHNFQLLQKLESFQSFDLPVMVGLSRKSMIWKALNQTAEEALNGSTVVHTIALIKKANILRIHDVKAAKEAVTLVCRLQG
jgi:dihydropteroate synthase